MEDLDVAEPDVGVAESIGEHMNTMELERQATGYLSFDPLATVSLHKYFDGLITAPNGVYQGKPFFTESRSAESLAQFVGWLIQMYDEDIKLLYMVQKYDQPERYSFDCEPHSHVVRFAIIKN